MMYDHFEPEEPEVILEAIVKSLVGSPDEVFITRHDGATTLILSIDVLSEDKGKIIGKQGVLIRSLNTLFRAMGCKIGRPILIEIPDHC